MNSIVIKDQGGLSKNEILDMLGIESITTGSYHASAALQQIGSDYFERLAYKNLNDFHSDVIKYKNGKVILRSKNPVYFHPAYSIMSAGTYQFFFNINQAMIIPGDYQLFTDQPNTKICYKVSANLVNGIQIGSLTTIAGSGNMLGSYLTMCLYTNGISNDVDVFRIDSIEIEGFSI